MDNELKPYIPADQSISEASFAPSSSEASCAS